VQYLRATHYLPVSPPKPICLSSWNVLLCLPLSTRWNSYIACKSHIAWKIHMVKSKKHIEPGKMFCIKKGMLQLRLAEGIRMTCTISQSLQVICLLSRIARINCLFNLVSILLAQLCNKELYNSTSIKCVKDATPILTWGCKLRVSYKILSCWNRTWYMVRYLSFGSRG
jgi:hypothetical protein